MRVLIAGTDFECEGHADAFASASCDVVGVVGRTPSVVTEVANRKAIPFSGSDWRHALTVCKPDIVSIDTPGGAHFEPIILKGIMVAGSYIIGERLATGANYRCRTMLLRLFQMST